MFGYEVKGGHNSPKTICKKVFLSKPFVEKGGSTQLGQKSVHTHVHAHPTESGLVGLGMDLVHVGWYISFFLESWKRKRYKLLSLYIDIAVFFLRVVDQYLGS